MSTKRQKKFKKQQKTADVEELVSQFGFDSSLPEFVKYREKLNGLIKKPCDVHWIVDWSSLKQVGLYDTVESKLRQEYLSPEGKHYFYQDWLYLICTDRYVFQDLCWEFHSTYELKEKPEGVKDKEFMTFRLRGEPHSISLEDFTRCLKIYTEKQMGEKYFWDYILSGARVSEISDIERFDPKTVWKNFSPGTSWSPPPCDGDGKVKVSCTNDLDDIYYRLIHLLFSLNIFKQREDTNKVTLSDLWYLEQIRSDTRVSIPYCVAYYLRHWAVDTSKGGKICGGHFVTLIGHHLGVKLKDEDDDDVSADGMFKKVLSMRGNPMIGPDEYHEVNVISMTSGVMKRYEKGLKQVPVNLQALQGGWWSPDYTWEEQEEQHGRRRRYEKVKNRMEAVREMIDEVQDCTLKAPQLSNKQLTEIEEWTKKIELQVRSFRSRIGVGADMENVSGGGGGGGGGGGRQVQEDEEKEERRRRYKMIMARMEKDQEVNLGVVIDEVREGTQEADHHPLSEKELTEILEWSKKIESQLTSFRSKIGDMENGCAGGQDDDDDDDDDDDEQQQQPHGRRYLMIMDTMEHLQSLQELNIREMINEVRKGTRRGAQLCKEESTEIQEWSKKIESKLRSFRSMIEDMENVSGVQQDEQEAPRDDI